jgi:hypothetical protein
VAHWLPNESKGECSHKFGRKGRPVDTAFRSAALTLSALIPEAGAETKVFCYHAYHFLKYSGQRSEYGFNDQEKCGIQNNQNKYSSP